jgi:hypothetical protein
MAFFYPIAVEVGARSAFPSEVTFFLFWPSQKLNGPIRSRACDLSHNPFFTNSSAYLLINSTLSSKFQIFNHPLP